MKISVIVGNPKTGSKTRAAAELLAERISGGAVCVLEVAELGADLLSFGAASVEAAQKNVLAADLLIFASPTYKATYTGLMKLFLDQFPTNALAGKVAIPMMMGGSLAHALAAELHFKPVLVELGAVCPHPGLFVLDKDFETSDTLSHYADRVRASVQ